jgi:hypothetical protein
MAHPTCPRGGKGGKPDTSAAAQGGGSKNKNKNKNKKKKGGGNIQTLARAPTAAAAAAAGGGRGHRGDTRPRQASDSDDGGVRCPMHNSMCHNAEECREIKKLVEQYRKHLKQQRDDGVPSHQREGK